MGNTCSLFKKKNHNDLFIFKPVKQKLPKCWICCRCCPDKCCHCQNIKSTPNHLNFYK